MDYKNIKTVEDAYKATGRDYSKRMDVSMLPERDQQHMLNNYDLKVVVEAINLNDDGTAWKRNFFKKETAYNPWFEVKATEKNPGGVGFSVSSCADWRTYSAAGSRLCFKDYERWDYCVHQFESLWLTEHIK